MASKKEDLVHQTSFQMFEFQEKALYEFMSFVDEPYVSFTLQFKFADGMVTDNSNNYMRHIVDNENALRALIQDVRLVDGNGKVIKSNLTPVWRKQQRYPNYLGLTFEFDSGVGVMLPPNAEVRGKVAQNVPGLYAIERTSRSMDIRRIRPRI